ncbi:MAG: hypothetical protein AB7S26_23480 [Sandaracinaceae bacterium]
MRWLRNIRLVIAAVIGIPLAIIAGVMALVEWWSGEGTVHVVAPLDSAVTILIDGAPSGTVNAGGHSEIELAQGDHEIQLQRADGVSGNHALDVDSGYFEVLTPASGQCFVELDGTEAYYGSAPRPEVEERHFDGQPIEVNGSTYYDDQHLPSQISDSAHVYLMFEVPCTMSAASDAELLAAAGYN